LYNFEKSAGHRDCRVNVLYRVELLLLRVQMQKKKQSRSNRKTTVDDDSL
jgi:hypothetical protein